MGIAASGQAQPARRAILIFLRHPVEPTIGGDLQMGISRNHLIASGHVRSPFTILPGLL
jgi:hypothetical protein